MNINEYSHLQQEIPVTVLSEEARSKDQPLLPYQLFFLDYQLYSPNKDIMNITMFCRIPAGTVDVQVLKDAVDRVFHHYAVFSTVFTFSDDGSLVQRCCPQLVPDIEILHCTEEYALAYRKDIFIKPYRLIDSLLWRHKILVTPENIYLLTDFHHTISDKGMCMFVYRQIFDVMRHREPFPDHYYLYLDEYARKMKSERAAEDLRELARLYPGTCSRFPKPDMDSRENENGTYFLPAAHSLSYYKNAAKRLDIPFGMALTTAGLLALSRYNHDPKVEIEWVYYGRREAWKKDLAGLMIAGIPAAMDFSALTTRRQILGEARRQYELGHRYSEYSYALHNMSPTVNECMKICYLPGNDDPGNLPEGSDLTVWLDSMEGMLCLVQIIIMEAGADQPLLMKVTYQGTRYFPENMERLLRLYLHALDELLSETSDMDVSDIQEKISTE